MAHCFELIEKACKGDIYLLLESIPYDVENVEMWDIFDLEIEPSEFTWGLESIDTVITNYIATACQMSIDFQSPIFTLNDTGVHGNMCFLSFLHGILGDIEFRKYVLSHNKDNQHDWYMRFLEIVDEVTKAHSKNNLQQKEPSNDNPKEKQEDNQNIIEKLETNQEKVTLIQMNTLIKLIFKLDLILPYDMPLEFLHNYSSAYLCEKYNSENLQWVLKQCTLLIREKEMAENLKNFLQHKRQHKDIPVHVVMGIGHLMPIVDEDIVSDIIQSHDDVTFFLDYHRQIQDTRFLNYFDDTQYIIHSCGYKQNQNNVFDQSSASLVSID